MRILRSMLNMGGIVAVDNFLEDGEYLVRKNKNSVKKFLLLYLDRSFSSLNQDPFKIFDYLRITGALNSDELINSKYFQTMPDHFAGTALKKARGLPCLNDDFYLFLGRRVRAIDIKVDLSLVDYLVNPIEKIFAFKDINLLIDVYPKLVHLYSVEIVWKLGSCFSLEEISRFLIAVNASGDMIIDTFLYIKENRLRVLKVMLATLLKLKKIQVTNIVEHLLYEPNITLDEIDYLTLEVLDSKNYDLMLAWVLKFNSSNTYFLIDELLGQDYKYIKELLLVLNEEKLDYVIKKIINKPEREIESLISFLCLNIDAYHIGKIDLIIDYLFANDRIVELNKLEALNMILAGSKHTLYFIRNIILTKEERDMVMEYLRQNNCFDLLIILGSYLLSGNKDMLVDDETIMINQELIGRFRKKSEEKKI